MPADKILAVLRDEIPAFDPDQCNRTFAALDVDSFDLITIRAGIERASGRAIPDDIWTTLETPAQVLALFADPPPDAPLRRSYSLNMPQMALGGMSESWLFKELGDAHWSLITEGLGAPSGALVDGTGARLYATFTRFRLTSSTPLVHWTENEEIGLSAHISRFGAGVFFSRQRLSGANGHAIDAEIMSSFSRRGRPDSNASLQKGQPEIPSACPIEEESKFPEFGHEYRARRGADVAPTIFKTRYDIIPYHDINGVGLLYFAAYPIISDICELRYRSNGHDWAERASTIHRDVFYFANCDAHDRLVYRLHGEQTAPGWIETESSLSRESDGTAMAYIITRKAVDHA